MSTRCTINFGYGPRKTPEAKIYRHCDGYPDTESGVLADLQRFFSAVQEQTQDTRFTDPCYLAAKFVVWQADENAESSARVEKHFGGSGEKKMLDFLSVGICMKDAGDIEYTYFVDCAKLDSAGRPTVFWRDVDQRGWKAA